MDLTRVAPQRPLAPADRAAVDRLAAVIAALPPTAAALPSSRVTYELVRDTFGGPLPVSHRALARAIVAYTAGTRARAIASATAPGVPELCRDHSTAEAAS